MFKGGWGWEKSPSKTVVKFVAGRMYFGHVLFSGAPKYPKSSPDFNAIEGWWRKLKLYLEEREPTERETRDEFLRRLRRAVDHVNTKCRAQGRKLCQNQKERARECKRSAHEVVEQCNHVPPKMLALRKLVPFFMHILMPLWV